MPSMTAINENIMKKTAVIPEFTIYFPELPLHI